MKKWIIVILGFLGMIGCSHPSRFSEESKTEKLVTLSGVEVDFNSVLKKHQGKKMILDVWASWCKDCIVRLPNLKELQKEHPNVVFVFLSQDKTLESWKRGIKRYGIEGEHYFMPQKKKGPLSDFLNLWWIPRYVVVDEKGEILLIKATKITDKNIQKALKN